MFFCLTGTQKRSRSRTHERIDAPALPTETRDKQIPIDSAPENKTSSKQPLPTNAASDASASQDGNELNKDILNVVGQRIIEKRVFAPYVHASLADRWSDVVKMGLPKEEKSELIKKYPVPENCLFLDPFELNQEISLAVGEAVRGRYQRIALKQKKLAGCVNGTSKSLTVLLERDEIANIGLIDR
uniref:Uncharacterized protein n=1 Tax=Trichogramma kaykai TaxID=54128 RepID=A0ABD2WEX5_9HYME